MKILNIGLLVTQMFRWPVASKVGIYSKHVLSLVEGTPRAPSPEVKFLCGLCAFAGNIPIVLVAA